MSFLGDFNFHFDDCSDPQVNRLKTMLSDFGLSQLVSVPTHHRGHTLDWVVVRSEESLVSLERLQDYAGFSDPYVLVCRLAITKLPPPTRLVTSRNIRAVSSSGFQADVKVLVDSTGEQRSDLDLEDLVDVYNDGLRQVVDRHAPSVTRSVRDRPSAPWMSEEVRAARRQRRRAERRWRNTRPTVHREIFVKERAPVRSCVQAAKRQFYCDRIDSICSSRQLLWVSNELLGKSPSAPLSSDVPRSELPQRFCDFFSSKISNLRNDLDSRSCEPLTFAVYNGPKLSYFDPVTVRRPVN